MFADYDYYLPLITPRRRALMIRCCRDTMMLRTTMPRAFIAVLYAKIRERFERAKISRREVSAN